MSNPRRYPGIPKADTIRREAIFKVTTDQSCESTALQRFTNSRYT